MLANKARRRVRWRNSVVKKTRPARVETSAQSAEPRPAPPPAAPAGTPRR